ncbi:unnamed protein product [Adineta steineri]|uniref:Uncharacterized protein n=1 Tax=Adineta steineri TaxID=433720 RepID=A0A813RVT5_9BILA|nr:unnamed protein product [Adineta steineri]CAF1244619.1 unnamed protein product [Adineta steineri]
MPACPRADQYSSLPPPGFADNNFALKRVQVIDLLQKLIDKCQREPQFVEQQPQQTDLLVSTAQYILLPTPISPDDKRDFLNNIIRNGQDLLNDENQMNNDEITLSINSISTLNEDKDATLTDLPSITPNNDTDGDFSLDDLADEYLKNEPTPSSINDKSPPSSEQVEPELTLDELSKTYFSSSPGNDILSKLLFCPLSNEPNLVKPQLETILFPSRLPSHDAADDADGIWKEVSSPFGQMFCTKIDETPTIVTRRVSTCLLDYSLYERLTRLVTLLPKQCIRNSAQQLSIRSNAQQYRSQRSNNDNRRPSHRPSFQQNSSQSYHNQRFPSGQNSRPYMNQNYPNQQGNPGGYFVDRRSQPQNRYPPPQPSFAPYPNEHQQQKGPPKNNPHGGNNGQQQQQQQKKKNQTNNQQGPNQQGSNQPRPNQQQQHQQQQRNTKKGSGGNKLTNEKSGVPGSGPSLNPK